MSRGAEEQDRQSVACALCAGGDRGLHRSQQQRLASPAPRVHDPGPRPRDVQPESGLMSSRPLVQKPGPVQIEASPLQQFVPVTLILVEPSNQHLLVVRPICIGQWVLGRKTV